MTLLWGIYGAEEVAVILHNKIIVLLCILNPFRVSGEFGDHDPRTCRSGYLSEYQFFPNQVCASQNSYYIW